MNATAERPKRVYIQRDRRRQDILKAAEAVLRERGLIGLTMDGVAERAAVHKPTIYRLFPSRQALAVAVVDKHFKALNRQVWKTISHSATVAEYIRDVIRLTLEFEREHDFPLRALSQGRTGEPLVDVCLAEYDHIFCQHWARFLKQQGLKAADATTAAKLINSFIYYALQNQAHVSTSANFDQVLETMMLGAIRALRIDEQRPADARPPRKISPIKSN